ncbi:response regulator transcription factor [Diaphorobacter aerolatus]|uniref:response regulator transcription factor n=1 Tax=Diaphorobacter aerolatus TaxID=1288495 RepID=UPI001D0135BE|nr:response regulator [Diaphorobacter aerolatus]
MAVVDGDEAHRMHVCRFLEESGYTTWGAGSIEDFYIGLLKEKADLVIVDLDLGVESGLALVRRLVAQRIPAIVLSLNAHSGARVASLDAGALQYFVKPLSLAELGPAFVPSFASSRCACPTPSNRIPGVSI